MRKVSGLSSVALLIFIISGAVNADPQTPAIMRNVTTIQDQQFHYPQILPGNTSQDGRIAVEGAWGGYYRLQLLKPENLVTANKNMMEEKSLTELADGKKLLNTHRSGTDVHILITSTDGAGDGWSYAEKTTAEIMAMGPIGGSYPKPVGGVAYIDSNTVASVCAAGTNCAWMPEGSVAVYGDNMVTTCEKNVDEVYEEVDPVTHEQKRSIFSRSPYACSVIPNAEGAPTIVEGGNSDCYDLTIMTATTYAVDANGDGNKNSNYAMLWSRDFKIAVANPKTDDAYIETVIVVGGKSVGDGFYEGPGFPGFMEPQVTNDGKLLVSRYGINKRARDPLDPDNIADCEADWETTGEARDSGMGNSACIFIDVFYSYNPTAACDVTGWTSSHSISHAFYDSQLIMSGSPSNKRLYGFAEYPLRAPDGTPIPDGEDSKGGYPWVDDEGNNIVLMLGGSQLDDRMYDSKVSCLDPYCSLKGAPGVMGQGGGRYDDTFGVSIVGLWTSGKIVYVDNLLNNTDYGLTLDHTPANYGISNQHVNIDLYEDSATVNVRVGSNRQSIVDTDNSGWPDGGYTNTDLFDSIENRWNFQQEFKPATFRDVVWKISNAKATDEFAFDDYVSPNAYIVSEMVPARKTHAGIYFGTNYDLLDGWDNYDYGDNSGPAAVTYTWKAEKAAVQNGATALQFPTPNYGQMKDYDTGDAKIPRTEPVALGGVKSRGLWLEGSYGVEYEATVNSVLANKSAWFASIFVDPRLEADGEYLRLITFSDASSVRIKRSELASERVTHVGLFKSDNTLATGGEFDISSLLSATTLMSEEKWMHLAFQVSDDGKHVDVYLDGYMVGSWADESLALFKLGDTGATTIGAVDAENPGMTGWIDEFKVFTEHVNKETICNHAYGSLIGVDSGTAVSDWKTLADAYSAPSGYTGHQEITDELLEYGKRHYAQYACIHNYTGDYMVTQNNLPRKANNESYSVRSAMHMPEGPIYHDAPRPESSSNQFCLSCHTATSKGGLSLTALDKHDWVVAGLDPRRQPMQPVRQVKGYIPQDWPQGASHKTTTAGVHTEGTYTLVDKLILDAQEDDMDGDGIRNAMEPAGLDPESSDTDNDGITDDVELQDDADSDGMPDGWELAYGLNPATVDSAGDLDGDGLSNAWELEQTIACATQTFDPVIPVDKCISPDFVDNTLDADGDSLGNEAEYAWATNPYQKDTDEDLMTDWEEIVYFSPTYAHPTNPDTDSDTILDGNENFDGDGAPNFWEVQQATRCAQLVFSPPITLCISPTVADSTEDADGDSLGNEAEYTWHSDPYTQDTDVDGMTDWQEIALFGWPPAYLPDKKDTNNNGVDDDAEDFDSDGLANIWELTNGLNPASSDTDGDSMPDGWELQQGFDPADDADGITDADGDNLGNQEEYVWSTNPHNPDSDSDGLTDWREIVAANAAGFVAITAGPLNRQDPPLVFVDKDIVAALDDTDYPESEAANLDVWSVLDGSVLFGLWNIPYEKTIAGVITTTMDAEETRCTLTINGDDCLPETTIYDGRKQVGNLDHACILDAGDATHTSAVHCFGDGDAYDQVSGKPSLTLPTDVAVGLYHSCALDASGVECWGKDTGSSEANEVPTFSSTPLAIAAGDLHTCAIIASSPYVQCWGDSNDGKLTPPTLDHPWQIVAGANHTCVINADYTVACWGKNNHYQAQVPTGLEDVVRLSTSGDETCASSITSDRAITSSVTCWPVNVDMDGDPETAVDTDSDGMPDGWEVQYGLNPLDDTGANGGTGDPDSDEMPNVWEYSYGLDPVTDDANDPAAGDSLSGCTVSWTNLQIYQHNLDPTVCNLYLSMHNDMDGDLVADVLMRDYDSDVYAGQWMQFKMANGAVSASNAFYGSFNLLSVANLDIDGDGVSDALARDPSTGDWYAYLVEDGQQNGVTLLSLPTSANWVFAAAGDFNADGTDDILLKNDSGTPAWHVYYLHNGDIDSDNSVSTLATSYGGSSYTSRAAGDMNGDGKADLLFSSDSGSVRTWYVYNFDTDSVSTPSGLNTSPYGDVDWEYQAVVDLNADGKTDVVLRDTSSGDWEGFTMGSSFASTADSLDNLDTASSISVASYGDFNGDATGDLLLLDSSTNDYSMYLTLAPGFTPGVRADSTTYTVNQVVIPDPSNGYAYLCTTAGTSDTSAPSFDTTPGNTTADGSVEWTNIGTDAGYVAGQQVLVGLPALTTPGSGVWDVVK